MTSGTKFSFDLKNNYIYYYKLQIESNSNGKEFFVDRHLVYNICKNKFDLFENSLLNYILKHSKIEHLNFNKVRALYGDPQGHHPRKYRGEGTGYETKSIISQK